jgi:hypothetical protein
MLMWILFPVNVVCISDVSEIPNVSIFKKTSAVQPTYTWCHLLSNSKMMRDVAYASRYDL